MIAIPTTAGTAAEVTINYVITDVENRRKFVCYDPHAIPVVAIIDADMMASMPPSLKAATGVDALTHAIEGYITKGAWELTDTLHLKAIEMIGRSLRGSIQGIARDAEGMAVGQYIAGMGFSNVGLGWCMGWPILWVHSMVRHTASPMQCYCRISWHTTPSLQETNIAKLHRLWAILRPW